MNTYSTSSSVRPTAISPKAAGILFVVLALTPELKLRVRSAEAAFSGSLDLQTAVELGIWCAVGAWMLRLWLKGFATSRYTWRVFTTGSKALILLAGFVVAEGVYSLSVRSGIRAVQFVVLVVATVIILTESRFDPDFLPSFWRWTRRSVILFAPIASVLSVAIPVWGFVVDVRGFTRFRWFAMHPIPTAGIIGLTLIMLISTRLAFRDQAFTRGWSRLIVPFLALGLAGMLVGTRARGALIGTLGALLVLVVLAPKRQSKRVATVGIASGVLALALAISVGIGAEQFTDTIYRGQTTEQVKSLSQRTELMEIGRELWREHPIVGYGYMMAGPLFSTYYTWAGESHNLLIEAAVSMGAVGVVVFGWFLGFVIFRIWQAWMDPVLRRAGLPAEAAAILILVMALGVVTESFAGAVGYETAGLVWALILAEGGLVSRNRPSQKERDVTPSRT